MKNKKVLLKVEGVSSTMGEPEDSMHLTTVGTLSGHKDGFVLRYTEEAPESDERHRVTMTIDKGVVTMTRKGPFSSAMVFEKGRRFESCYRTPYGAMDMSIFPTKVDYAIDDKGTGEVKLSYLLDMAGTLSTLHEMHIRFGDNLA